MSITLPTELQQEWVARTVRDWPAARIHPVLELWIGSEDYSGMIHAMDWGSEADSPAIDLAATLADRVPRRLENAPVTLRCRLDTSEGAIYIPQLDAIASRPIPSDDGLSTELIAASPGSLLDKATLDSRASYPGLPPSLIVQDALSRVPYALGRLDIRLVDTPRLDLTGEAAFEAEQNPADILERVRSQTDYVHFDTVEKGARAFPDPGIGERLPVVAHLTRADLLEYTEPEPTEEQYTGVQVNGPDYNRYTAYAPVDTTELPYPPPVPVTLHISSSVASPLQGQQIAFDRAERIRRGLYANTLLTAYDPLAEKYDAYTLTVEYTERGPDSFLTVQETWFYLTLAYRHELAEDGEITTTRECLCFPMDTRELPAPPSIVPGRSRDVRRQPWGLDTIGRPYLSEELPWVRVEGGRLFVDVALARTYGVYVYYDHERRRWVVSTTAPALLYPGEALYPGENLYPRGE